MEQRIADNLILDSSVNSGVEYSPAMRTEGKSGKRLELRAIYASGTIAAAAMVEQSVDMVNWSAPLFTVSTLTTAPTSATGLTNSTSSATLAGYVRVKFTNTANKACVAAVVDFFDYVP